MDFGRKIKARAAVVGAIAGTVYLFTASRFACCLGEDGFSANVVDGMIGASAILVAACAVQSGWRGRTLRSIAGAVALFLLLCAIVLAARPSWDDYVFARPLLLGWRTAIVAAVAAIATMVQLKLTWSDATLRSPA